MYKSKLHELCHKRSWEIPVYSVRKVGPDHKPRFTGTVTVNGFVFETINQCLSSKEAQNTAAQLAFLSSTDTKSHPLLCNSSIPSSSPGVGNPPEVKDDKKPAGVGNLPEVKDDKKPAGVGNLPDLKDDKKPAGVGNLPDLKDDKKPAGVGNLPEVKDDKKLAVAQNLFKNRLQHYAQKKNLALPMYSYEREGPPHASRFKCRVSIEGDTYESLEYFSTIREAEHAAAKVACDSLLLNEVVEDKSGLYKNMLQELAQKEGFPIPCYNTTVSGPPHAPIFVSNVEIYGQLYQGQEAKNKKVAEMNAAKVAYISLQELRTTQRSTISFPDYNTKEAFKASSSVLHSVPSTGDLLQNVEQEDNLISKSKNEEDKGRTIQDPAFISHGYDIKEALKVSSSILQSIISTSDVSKTANPKPDLIVSEQEGEEDEGGNQENFSSKSTTGDTEVKIHRSPTLPLEEEANAKRHRCSSSSDIIYASLRDPFPSKSASSEDSTSSHSGISECSTNSVTKSTVILPAEMGELAHNKVLIYSRRLNLTISDGTTEFPFSDDKWVALKREL